MRTKEQWLEGIRKMKPNLYMGGDKLGREDERLIPTTNVMGPPSTWRWIPNLRI